MEVQTERTTQEQNATGPQVGGYKKMEQLTESATHAFVYFCTIVKKINILC